jgi:predicted DNA-binding transcriptional regulator AlpA
VNPIALLDQIARDPRAASSLSPETALALLAQVAIVQAALVARLLTAQAEIGSRRAPSPDPPDRLLTPHQAAERLGVTSRWLYRHAPRLPFTRRLSRKVLRFSEAGLWRWQASRAG